MILIGQYDSPFVRRIAVTLQLYGLDYEHRKWSVWGDADRIAEFNPLRRVPTLLLDDGSALIETFSIIDYLDELVGPERALLPVRGPIRREGLRLTALATGLADKCVSLLYEKLFRSSPSEAWVNRCELQIEATLGALERERSERTSLYFLGHRPLHPDVMTACVVRFLREAHPHLFDAERYPRLLEGAETCEQLPEFQRVVQPITNVL
jgi:glutathione S-transferase